MSSAAIRFDRSRVETGQTCLRKRYWQYHYQGTGIERVGLSLPLTTGSAVHRGVESLIQGCSADLAVEHALELYQEAVEQAGLPGETTPEFQAQLQEQYSLVEGMIRCWGAVRLQAELETYESLGLEREEQAVFGAVGQQQLILMARPDWLVRRKADGALFIKNFKTVADAGKSWREQWRYDMQTLSECLAVEERLSAEAGQPVKLSGVIIQGLLKGRKAEYPVGSGKYQHNSPLIRCWYRKGEPPMTEDEFYPLSRYEYFCTEPHKMGNGKLCKGGANHRLSGVYKAEVKEVFPGGIAGWIAWLAENDREVLDSQIVELDPILRSDWEIERWRRQTLASEDTIAWKVEEVAQNPEKLEELFPMSTQHSNCTSQFGSECSMLDICWGPAAEDPLSTGNYRVRIPNHPTESQS